MGTQCCTCSFCASRDASQKAPSTMLVTFAGVVNDDCNECTRFNDTFALVAQPLNPTLWTTVSGGQDPGPVNHSQIIPSNCAWVYTFPDPPCDAYPMDTIILWIAKRVVAGFTLILGEEPVELHVNIVKTAFGNVLPSYHFSKQYVNRPFCREFAAEVITLDPVYTTTFCDFTGASCQVTAQLP